MLICFLQRYRERFIFFKYLTVICMIKFIFMQSILSTNYYVHFEESAYTNLGQYLNDNFHSKIFILVDTNTKKYCLPLFLNKSELQVKAEIIEVSAGEIHKNITTCNLLWNKLSELGADRKSCSPRHQRIGLRLRRGSSNGYLRKFGFLFECKARCCREAQFTCE